MQVLGLAEIRLAEDFLSQGAWEWVFETWKYTKFTQFWSKSMGLAVTWPNKFLSGEFHVFRGKVVIIWSSP